MPNILSALGFVAALSSPCAQSALETPSVKMDSLAGPTLVSSPDALTDSAQWRVERSPAGLVPARLFERSFSIEFEQPTTNPEVRSTVAARRTSIWVGGLLGLGIGAALGTTVGAEACLHEPGWHCAVKVGVPMAAIGAVVGWLAK
jgi:hypothetical protein